MTSGAAARTALLGLSVGDAFGSMIDSFGAQLAQRASKRLVSMKRPWRWTDDTAMAISIVEVLEQGGHIDPDALATAFTRRFVLEPNRGYGAGAYALSPSRSGSLHGTSTPSRTRCGRERHTTGSA